MSPHDVLIVAVYACALVRLFGGQHDRARRADCEEGLFDIERDREPLHVGSVFFDLQQRVLDGGLSRNPAKIEDLLLCTDGR